MSKLLPDTKQTIEKLKNILKPIDSLKDNPKLFLNALIFFLGDEQIKIVDSALAKAMPAEGTKAEKLAEAITTIAEDYLK